MEEVKALKVISADRLNGYVIIGFSDGRCGLYSPDLLYASLVAARELFDTDGTAPERRMTRTDLSSI